MGYALETIIGFNGSLTGGSTFDNLTAGSGNSFAVRNYPDGSAAWLEDCYAANSAHAYQVSIKSPRMHDQVKGLLLAGTPLSLDASANFNPQSLIPGPTLQRLYSTDVLSVTANGTAADVQNAAFSIRYENLPGIAARFHSWAEIQPLIVNEVGILTQPTPAAGAGDWGAGVVLNAIDNRLHADTDYAWLGFQSTLPTTAVTMQGIDFGNLRIGGPGAFDIAESGSFWITQDQQYGTPHIPVFNSNNQGGILVAISKLATSGTPNVTIRCAQLSRKLPSPLG
jgi:hypothetical protein